MLTASFLLAVASLAEPQNFRFGADLRLRGYYADHDDLTRRAATAAPPRPLDDARTGDLFGRARVTLSGNADWTDTVSTRLAARGDGAWARRDEDDEAHADPCEAWLLLENPAFLPLSLKAGRQGVHRGRGLILSGRDADWVLDAVHLEYDVFPCAAEVLYASVAHLSPDSLVDLFWWAAARRDVGQDQPGEIEAYFGAFSAAGDARPLVAGFRGELEPNPNWALSAEAARQFGERPGGHALSAFVADLGLARRFPTLAWKPALNARWTFASGDADPGGKRTFVPLLNHEDWGRVLSPRLSNIHVFKLGAEVAPWSPLKVSLDVYGYVQAEPVAGSASDGIFNNGGYQVPANGLHRRLGTEADFSLRYARTESCFVELSAGRFVPGDAYSGQPRHESATEVCAEVHVKF